MQIFAFDHNVIVSAILIPNGIPARLLEAILSNQIVVTTQEILSELEEVLSRPKFDRYAPIETRREFISRYAARCRVLEVATRIIECRDPDDDKFLSLALESRADFLISGDIHLLELHPFRNIPILTPAQYLALHPANHLP